jgi:hypothetical protein
MAHRLQVLLSQRQYVFLAAEADRSSISMAELVRRALDTTYGPDGSKPVTLISHAVGRRAGVRLR